MSDAMRFEEAGAMRDLLTTVEEFDERQKMAAASGDDADIFGFYAEPPLVAVNLFHLRNGQIVDRRDFYWEDQRKIDAPEFFSSLLLQIYLDQEFVPNIIHVPVDFEDREVMEELLSEKKTVVLYPIGTLAMVHKVVKMPNQSLFVFAEGLERVRLVEYTQLAPFMKATVKTVTEVVPEPNAEVEALQRNILTLFQQIVAGSPTLSDEFSTVAMNIEEPGRLVDFVASLSAFAFDARQAGDSGDLRRALCGWTRSISTWQKSWKCSSYATRSSPRCRTGCSRRSVSTTCASR